MSNQSTNKYLSAQAFFSEFSDDVLNFLAECSSTQEVKQGQILFRQGENADKFYVVRDGCNYTEIPAIMGPTLEIHTLGKDQVLGWSWLISPYNWNFQTMAKEDTELLMFDGSAILARCDQEPKFGYELLKKFAGLMSARLNASSKKIMDEWNPAGFA